MREGPEPFLGTYASINATFDVIFAEPNAKRRNPLISPDVPVKPELYQRRKT